MIKYTYILLIIIGAISCKTPVKENSNDQKWSIKMADAVMARFDSLAHYNGRSHAGWYYDVAFLGAAIDKIKTDDPKYAAYMKTFMDELVDSSGHILSYNMEKFNIDLIRPATNLITLAQRSEDPKYEKAIPQFIEQLNKHPKTNSGGYWHKKIYPWQMWLDGIYMASPFLAAYAKEYNQPEWFDEVALQITLIYEKTLDENTGLLYHAWDESREQQWADPETGQSPNFWSRSMGWYLMAIVDVLDYLPEEHPQHQEIIEILQKTCNALVKVRDKSTGVWYQVLDRAGDEGNYPEASGSAMYVYAFAKGAKKGYLDSSYAKIADSAFDAMLETFIITDEDGLPSVVNICGGCGLGGNPYRDGTYEYYINEKIVKNDCKGVAPFILAAIELDR